MPRPSGTAREPRPQKANHAQSRPVANGYVAYQFYKHSKYGPCDKLALTDGTFSIQADGSWTYQNDGTFHTEFKDRELGNTVLLAPARKIRWLRSLRRCPNEFEGYYPEDVKPFGFRVIRAVANGFTFTVGRLGESDTTIAYRLTIVDPSLATLGAAIYAWSVTDHLGTTTTTSGEETAITVARDEPFTLEITRMRGETVDTMTWRERGNDLDRNGGQAVIRNLVGP